VEHRVWPVYRLFKVAGFRVAAALCTE